MIKSLAVIGTAYCPYCHIRTGWHDLNVAINADCRMELGTMTLHCSQYCLQVLLPSMSKWVDRVAYLFGSNVLS